MFRKALRIDLLLFLGLALNAFAAPDPIRLVISAGALSDKRPFEAFYNSRIFKGEKASIFYISDASSVRAFRAPDGTIFCSDETISSEQIVKANSEIILTEKKALIGQSYLGFLDGDLTNNDELSNIARYLRAGQKTVGVEVRMLDGHRITALNPWGEQKKLLWPKDPKSLVAIPAVKIASANSEFVMVARAVGSWENKMGLVDELLKKNGPSTSYIDLGTSKGGGKSLNLAIVSEVAKRKPVVVFAGTYEIGALLLNPSQKSLLPFVFPFVPYAQYSKENEQSKAQVDYWSLAYKENIWRLYDSLGKVQKLDDALLTMGEEKNKERPLNIVRVFSEEAALAAAQSAFVDLVLMVVNNTRAQLPSQEVLNFKNSMPASHEQRAPIVHVSPMDVSEIYLQKDRVKVIRHNISDQSPEIFNQRPGESFEFLKPGLPGLVKPDGTKLIYRDEDFGRILGGMMLDYTGARVAIFEAENNITPVKGAINRELAMSQLKRNGVLTTAHINGRELKKILALKAKGLFQRKLSIFGLDEKNKTIGDIAINDAVRYKIAFSEAALLECFNISMLGGFNEEYAIRAPWVEQIYGKVENLWFVGGPKTMTISDTSIALEKAIKTLNTQISFQKLLEKELGDIEKDQVLRFIKMPGGEPKTTILWDINYLDLGLMINSGNSVYKNYLDNNNNERLPMSRGGVPIYMHLILFSKMNLFFDLQKLVITLGNTTKFMQTNVHKKPERDKTTFNLDFRLPWERTIFRGKDFVWSPILKALYETKLAPLPGLSVKSEADWRREKVLPRVKSLDILLGFNLNAKKLGFSLDLGGMMSSDFNQNTINDALDFGPGFNFDGRWPLFGPLELSTKTFGSYKFPMPKNAAKNKAALGVEGTVWLRLARFYDFSLSIMSDFLIATLQQKPKDVALSSVFGVTISYGAAIPLLN